MTNLQKFYSLPIRELAELLIHYEMYDDGEYYYDEYISNYKEYIVCPDGEEFYGFDMESAIEHTINWLNSEEGDESDSYDGY